MLGLHLLFPDAYIPSITFDTASDFCVGLLWIIIPYKYLFSLHYQHLSLFSHHTKWVIAQCFPLNMPLSSPYSTHFLLSPLLTLLYSGWGVWRVLYLPHRVLPNAFRCY